MLHKANVVGNMCSLQRHKDIPLDGARPLRQARSTNLSSADGVLIGQIRPGDGAARLIAARLVRLQLCAKLDRPGDPLGTRRGRTKIEKRSP